MSAYYNDNDPHVCKFVRNLISLGLVPDGEVDCRSILEVKPSDLQGFTQCHFFCGILGWPEALRLAGWPPTRPLWSCSFPCQPFAVGGKQKGGLDDRNLWSCFPGLVRECRPECIVGEQVSRAVGFKWLDRVCADLEAEAYSVGAVVLGAHSAGAPHIRQRLYWAAVANDRSQRIQGDIQKEVPREPSFSWCKNGGGVENLRGRPDIPEPLLRSYGNGISRRLVKAFGNAIIPQTGAIFLESLMESLNELTP